MCASSTSYFGNGKSTNRYHIPLLMRRQNKVRVKTIYAPRLGDLWDRWDGVCYTDNVDELLGDPEIDVVIVTTPPHVHYQIARQVIEAGKNVVLEKPFVPSVREAEELFALAHKHGVMIQGYQNRRFDSDFLTMQKVIASGKLGELFEVEMHWDYYRPEVPEGMDHYAAADSFVYSLACHAVDQMLSYFGMPDDTPADFGTLTYYDDSVVKWVGVFSQQLGERPFCVPIGYYGMRGCALRAWGACARAKNESRKEKLSWPAKMTTRSCITR